MHGRQDEHCTFFIQQLWMERDRGHKKVLGRGNLPSMSEAIMIPPLKVSPRTDVPVTYGILQEGRAIEHSRVENIPASRVCWTILGSCTEESLPSPGAADECKSNISIAHCVWVLSPPRLAGSTQKAAPPSAGSCACGLCT